METSCGPGRRERRLLRLGLLVHADVVDEEPLRKDLVVDALLTAPAASDGEVEKEVLLLVERPGDGPASLVPEGEVLLAIDEEVDALPVPLDGVDVELLRRFGNGDLVAFVRLLDVVVLPGVHVRVDDSRVEADVLHDVDLAAGRPADLAHVRAQGPNRGPGSPAGGQLRLDLDAPVGPGGLSPRDEARGGVLRGLSVQGASPRAIRRVPCLVPHGLFPRLDDEDPVLDPRVLLTLTRVVLLLLVAHEPLLVVPLLRIRRPVLLELVRPDELPLGAEERGAQREEDDEGEAR